MKTALYIAKINNLFQEKDKNKYSHLIMFIDNSAIALRYIYVKREENIKDVIFDIVSNPANEIKEIYNYDIDKDSQINTEQAYNIRATYDKVLEAYKFAEIKHCDQKRKDGTPYISHPIAVAEYMEKYFEKDPQLNEYLAAAYLHDTVEDTTATLDEIKEKFGDYVAYLVHGVTSDKYLQNKLGKTDYLCKKIEKMPNDVLNLKLCDRLANVTDLYSAPKDFIEKYTLETRTIINYQKNNRNLTPIQRNIIKDIENELYMVALHVKKKI